MCVCVCVCVKSELISTEIIQYVSHNHLHKDRQTGRQTFCRSSSVSIGSTVEQDLASMEISNLAYLLKPQELHRKGSFSS